MVAERTVVERAAEWLYEHMENTHYHPHEKWRDLPVTRQKIYRVTAKELVDCILEDKEDSELFDVPKLDEGMITHRVTRKEVTRKLLEIERRLAKLENGRPRVKYV